MVNSATSVGIVQRINTEDIPGAPAWVGNLISQINMFIQSVNSSLAGNLQIPGNVTGQISKLSFTTNSNYSTSSASTFTPISYRSTLPYQTRVLLLGQINIVSFQAQVITNTITISDWSDSNGVVSINFITGLLPNTKYNMTILAL